MTEAGISWTSYHGYDTHVRYMECLASRYDDDNDDDDDDNDDDDDDYDDDNDNNDGVPRLQV